MDCCAPWWPWRLRIEHVAPVMAWMSLARAVRLECRLGSRDISGSIVRRMVAGHSEHIEELFERHSNALAHQEDGIYCQVLVCSINADLNSIYLNSGLSSRLRSFVPSFSGSRSEQFISIWRKCLLFVQEDVARTSMLTSTLLQPFWYYAQTISWRILAKSCSRFTRTESLLREHSHGVCTDLFFCLVPLLTKQ